MGALEDASLEIGNAWTNLKGDEKPVTADDLYEELQHKYSLDVIEEWIEKNKPTTTQALDTAPQTAQDAPHETTY